MEDYQQIGFGISNKIAAELFLSEGTVRKLPVRHHPNARPEPSWLSGLCRPESLRDFSKESDK